jgi:hypothetical protein
MTDETVTIPKAEYKELLEESKWLMCLEAAGVDSWEGVEYAQEMMEEQNELMD